MKQAVSDSELELMKIIWSFGGSAFYAQIASELESSGNTWNKNTVITLLSRLVEKGMLTTAKFGRRNEYRAVITQEDYQDGLTKSFVDRVYKGSVKGMVAALIQKEMLTKEDYRELKEFWDNGKE